MQTAALAFTCGIRFCGQTGGNLRRKERSSASSPKTSEPVDYSSERTSLKLPAVVIAGTTVRRRCTDDLREKSDKAIIVVSV
jgi:hypothetical protein